MKNNIKMLGKKMSNSSKGRTTSKNAKGASSTSGAQIQSSAAVATEHESFFNSPSHIKMEDNLKLLPHYSIALSRPHDEPLPVEELDPVQTELESLLSSVALRFRYLKNEYESLDREDKRPKKGVFSAGKPSNLPSQTGKRKRVAKKTTSAKNNKHFGGQQAKLSKLKTNSSHSPARSLHTDGSMDATSHPQGASAGRIGNNQNPKLLLPKNDIPNKFWLSVEPYCMPITQEDIKLLDDLMDEYNGPLVPPIPELGPHYTTQWAAEDLRDEQDNSNQNAKTNKRFTNVSNDDVANMLKKGDKLLAEGITGPLTQRLIAGLVENHVMPNDNKNNITNDKNDSNDSSGENKVLAANRSSIISLASALKNGVDVERSVKQELIELGILDKSDFPKEKEDEILNEIKRVRAELNAIARYNFTELKTLHMAAKEEMKRLEVKRKLDVVDQQIVELYKKVWTAKQKRRPLTKQEKNDIFRLTEEQKRLSDQLDTMPIPGFDSTLSSPSLSSSPLPSLSFLLK